MKPILLLEINEIPWRLIKLYKDNDSYPHIKEFFSKSCSYTSLAVDTGELSPWVTWPSLHRGMPNTEHKIYNLGQDPKTFCGTPIWEEFRQRGASIGVFGSLQSWPPKDPGPNGFYVPDTFAHDPQCIPHSLEPIQKFNLDQVAKNGRVVTSNPLFSALSPSFILALFKSGVRIRTVAKLAWQLVMERIDKNRPARRSIYQAVLFWDIFRKLYNHKNPPAFTTFFTNHVAAVMHRYWHHIFPEDFPKEMQPHHAVHVDTMNFAFGILDEILGEVLLWMRENQQLTVIFATSMGQDKLIHDDHHGFELSVSDLSQLMTVLGMPDGSYKNLLAMVPQSAVEVKDSGLRQKLKQDLLKIKSHSGKPMFEVSEIGESLSMTIRFPPPEDCRNGTLTLANGSTCFMRDAGITVWEVEAGTAYHIPEGIFCVAGWGKDSFAKNTPGDIIHADKIKHKLMNLAELTN